MIVIALIVFFFFFNDTATTEIYTLSLHDALPISDLHQVRNEWSDFMPTVYPCVPGHEIVGRVTKVGSAVTRRSEEHTSELQSQSNLVCRLLLEKKKKPTTTSGHNLSPTQRTRRLV